MVSCRRSSSSLRSRSYSTWADGRTFAIDAVRDFRPAGTLGCDCRGDCYTVVIRGEEKHLFFERVDPLFSGRVGRWFVEKTV